MGRQGCGVGYDRATAAMSVLRTTFCASMAARLVRQLHGNCKSWMRWFAARHPGVGSERRRPHAGPWLRRLGGWPPRRVPRLSQCVFAAAFGRRASYDARLRCALTYRLHAAAVLCSGESWVSRRRSGSRRRCDVDVCYPGLRWACGRCGNGAADAGGRGDVRTICARFTGGDTRTRGDSPPQASRRFRGGAAGA